VSKPGFERVADIGMEHLGTLAKDQSLGICFQCHATKTVLREDPYLQGDRFEDFFSLLLPLFSEEPFTVDGRVRSFDYQSNHLFSDCYLNGSMTCVDCHDPHSQGYRDVFGRALVGKFDNRQCTSCHASKAVGTDHSHHKADSPGNQCTSCHMPFLQHRGVGQHFQFARSDHTIPIPRPTFDQQLGIENACQKCHGDKDLGWQEAAIREWYGDIKPYHPLIAGLIRSLDVPDPDFTRDLLLAPESNHPMAQMRGLGTFIRRFVRPGKSVSDPEVVKKLQAFAQHEHLDLKALALMALHVGYSDRPEIRDFLDRQRTNLGTNESAIKARWAISADDLGSALAINNDLPSAIACLHKSLEIQPANVATMSHLALAYLKSGNTEESISTLRKAIATRPATPNLHFQLAQVYVQVADVPRAIEALEQGLQYAPHDEMARVLLAKLRAL
jgi:Flp pilus assembly protein TadD